MERKALGQTSNLEKMHGFKENLQIKGFCEGPSYVRWTSPYPVLVPWVQQKVHLSVNRSIQNCHFLSSKFSSFYDNLNHIHFFSKSMENEKKYLHSIMSRGRSSIRILITVDYHNSSRMWVYPPKNTSLRDQRLQFTRNCFVPRERSLPVNQTSTPPTFQVVKLTANHDSLCIICKIHEWKELQAYLLEDMVYM